jgi:hypothetical protein
MPNGSRAFRDELRRELPAWQDDGLVTPEAARALEARYALAAADAGTPPAARELALAAAGLIAAAAAGWVLVATDLARAHPGAGIFLGYALGAAMAVGAFALGSAALAVLAPLATATLVQLSLDAAHVGRAAQLAFAAIGAAAAAAPLVARGARARRAAEASRGAGRAFFYLAAFALSFTAVANAARLEGFVPGVAYAVVPALAAAGLALGAGLRRDDVDPLARGEAMLLAGTAVALGLGHHLESGTGTAFVANLGLAFVAIGRIVRGRAALDRLAFWEGTVAGAALVVFRVVEVHSGRGLVAAAIVLCAAAVAAAGVAFERRRSARIGARR